MFVVVQKPEEKELLGRFEYYREQGPSRS